MSVQNYKLLPEQLFFRLRNWFVGHRVPFICGILAGFLTHGYMLANKIPNHDDVMATFYKGDGLSSGRWALDWMSYLFPDYSMPWIYGILTVFLITVSACVILDIFSIRSGALQGIFSALLVTFPSLTGTMSYMFTAVAYAASFFFAALAVSLFLRSSRLCRLFALLLMVFSVGIYQAYFAVGICLLLLAVLQQFLLEKQETRKTVWQGVFSILFLLLSLALYLLIFWLLLVLKQQQPNIYASSNLRFGELSVPEVLQSIYRSFYHTVLHRQYAVVPTTLSKYLHLIFFAGTFAVTLMALRHKKISTKIFIFVLILLLPVGIYSVMFLTTDVHTLVMYSFVSLYLLAAIMLDSPTQHDTPRLLTALRRFAAQAVAVSLLLIAATNVYIGNQAYLRMQLVYENTYAFYTSLATQIKMTPGFDENAIVALIGSMPRAVYSLPEFDETEYPVGTQGIQIHSYSKKRFLQLYVGFDVPFATPEEIREIRQTEEYRQMPQYPYEGSVRAIGRFIVVKLSDEAP